MRANLSNGRASLVGGTVVAGVATVGSLYFSEVLGLIPCELCWYQRILMYPLVLVVGVGALENRLGVYRTALPLSVAGTAVAADPDYDSIPNLTAAAVQAVEAEVTVEEAGDDGWSPFRLRLRVEEGMHLNAAEVDHPSLVPTSLAASKGELRRVEMPPGEPLEQAGETLDVYRGEVEITGQVRPAEKGVPYLLLTYQACDDRRCLPQVTNRVRLP